MGASIREGGFKRRGNLIAVLRCFHYGVGRSQDCYIPVDPNRDIVVGKATLKTTVTVQLISYGQKTDLYFETLSRFTPLKKLLANSPLQDSIHSFHIVIIPVCNIH